MSANDWPVFLLLCLTMSGTPGPNSIYLVSRALCQGRAAAFVSLWGVAAGFTIHLAVAASGLAALLRTTPAAYEAVRWAGVAYLFWLAMKAWRPRPALHTVELAPVPPRRLFVMGLLTNVLNPQAALLYLTIFTQFVHPERGPVLGTSLLLGAVQILISLACNSGYIIAAAALGRAVDRRPGAVRVQRWIMGGVLGALALRLAVVAPR
jgi:threonine/homoserine/homoserine lactone efflux protein